MSRTQWRCRTGSARGVAGKLLSENGSHYRGVSQLHSHQSRTVPARALAPSKRLLPLYQEPTVTSLLGTCLASESPFQQILLRLWESFGLHVWEPFQEPSKKIVVVRDPWCVFQIQKGSAPVSICPLTGVSAQAILDSVKKNCKYLMCCIFPVLKPLTCGRQSRCPGWIYKLPGGQKLSFKLAPLSVGFSQRRPLKLIKRPPFIFSPRVRFVNRPACNL